MGNYTAKDITVLEGLEPVRKRPGMYIGGVGSAGLHHLVWEILDNSIDEAINGHAKSIEVVLEAVVGHRGQPFVLLDRQARRRERRPVRIHARVLPAIRCAEQEIARASSAWTQNTRGADWLAHRGGRLAEAEAVARREDFAKIFEGVP